MTEVGLWRYFALGKTPWPDLRLGNYTNKVLLRGTTDPREVVLAGSRYKIVDFGQYTWKTRDCQGWFFGFNRWNSQHRLKDHVLHSYCDSCWVLKPPSKPTFTGTIRLTLIYSPLNALPE